MIGIVTSYKTPNFWIDIFTQSFQRTIVKNNGPKQPMSKIPEKPTISCMILTQEQSWLPLTRLQMGKWKDKTIWTIQMCLSDL